MSETSAHSLTSSRYGGDVALLDGLRADEEIAPRLDQVAAVRFRNSTRARLLSHAVRVDLRLLPVVARAFERLQARVDLEGPIEAYVHEEPRINAFVTRGRTRTLVVLSSAAVNRLSEAELDFVIGHELGHAVYGHLDVPARFVLETHQLGPRGAMQLTAWMRAAEISADRAGLICCGSLEIAGTTLFKMLSGLTLDGLQVSPAEFAEQWDHLEREVVTRGGGEDEWQLSHPFPPLRMKAMMIFWESGIPQALAAGSAIPDGALEKADAEVARLLAMMDPLARASADAADPILADFFLWGGIFIALANDDLHDAEVERLEEITPGEKLRAALDDAELSPALCLTRFGECLANRSAKLKAVEIHRIMQGLLQVAVADGDIDETEQRALEALGNELGITEIACQLLTSKFLQEMESHVPS